MGEIIKKNFKSKIAYSVPQIYEVAEGNLGEAEGETVYLLLGDELCGCRNTFNI